MLVIIIWKKKENCRLTDFAFPADSRINIKESIKTDNYLNLIRELRKLWNRRVTVIPILIGELGAALKGSWRNWKLMDKSRSSKLQQCWDKPEYWGKSWKHQEIGCHSDFSERILTNAGVKKSQGVKYLNRKYVTE